MFRRRDVFFDPISQSRTKPWGQWGPLWSKPCQLHPSDQVTRIDPPNDGGHKKSFEQVT